MEVSTNTASAPTKPSADAVHSSSNSSHDNEAANLAEYEAMSKKLDDSKIKRLLAKLRPIQTEIESNDPEI